jgi:hypothetical protein
MPLSPKYRKEEYVYKDCEVRMSKPALYKLMYAVIMCHAQIPTTFHMGRDGQYTPEQNRYNFANIKIYIHPEYIPQFEELSGVTLEAPIQIQLNNGK